MSLDRELLLLAFGSPAEPDAQLALEIVVDAIQAEAKALGDENTDSPRQLALACRLEAFKTFVTEYLTVTWSKSAAKPEAAP